MISVILSGIKKYKFWSVYGLNDVKAKYRRTKLGQWWITISIALFILIIGVLLKENFYSDFDLYLVYLSAGYIAWLFLQDCVISSCNTLIQSKQFLLQNNWPVTVFIFRIIYREIIVLLHHSVLLLGIFIWFGHFPGLINTILSLCGLIFVIFTTIWVCLILSILCLRYTDLASLMQSLMRFFFFATPIFWVDRNLSGYGELIILFNPFSYFISIIRDPLMGYDFPYEAWFIAIIISIAMFFISLITLYFTKKKISYWL